MFDPYSLSARYTTSPVMTPATGHRTEGSVVSGFVAGCAETHPGVIGSLGPDRAGAFRETVIVPYLPAASVVLLRTQQTASPVAGTGWPPQVGTQLLFAQTSPAPHACIHMPQC
jgi:hypothetical protein